MARRPRRISRWGQAQYSLHPNHVSSWKKQLLEDGPRVFSRSRERGQAVVAEQEAELYEQIGRLKMEVEWVKKSCLNQVKPNER